VTSKSEELKEGVKSKIRLVDSIFGGKPDGDVPTEGSGETGIVIGFAPTN
jgi:hypothetical protein